MTTRLTHRLAIASWLTAARALDSSRARAPKTRRALLGGASALASALAPAHARAEGLEDRNRGLNDGALIQTDFYFTTGRRPPRVLNVENLPKDDPKWNAWGECAKDANGGNACTYIPLKQRYDAYSKYGISVAAGAEDFVALGSALKKKDLSAVGFLLDAGDKGRSPGAARSAARRALLLADGLLISANSGSLGREILVARYYVNEIHFATESIATIMDGAEPVDWAAAADAWRLGVDSYNSFFAVVNTKIAPKVGEKFVAIRA